MRILHLTDPHLFADAGASLRGAVTCETLKRTLAHYQDSGFAADMAWVTGDLIQDDSPASYRLFKQLLAPLGIPVHCIPGNHDIAALMQHELTTAPFSYCADVMANNWLLVGLDSCVAGKAGGEVSADELQRLASSLRNSAAQHVMVCLHHPPVSMRSRWLDTVGLQSAAEFLNELASHQRIRLLLSGHVHQPVDEIHDGMRIIATPSTCRQFLPRSDEFALDDRPPAYRTITLHDSGEIDTELVWVD